jgi:hypothetical protein
MLLVLLCRGAGQWSLDYAVWPRIRRPFETKVSTNT